MHYFEVDFDLPFIKKNLSIKNALKFCLPLYVYGYSENQINKIVFFIN